MAKKITKLQKAVTFSYEDYIVTVTKCQGVIFQGKYNAIMEDAYGEITAQTGLDQSTLKAFIFDGDDSDINNIVSLLNEE